MTCLDDDTVLGLVEGRLAAPVVAQLDVHLDGCVSCRAVIAQVSRANVVERGRTVGRYTIGDLLGTGAMGRVYAAWERDLDRTVAIKLLRDDSHGSRARMLREAQAMARLSHPNVVTVHEVGTTDDGVFVAMELVDGDTLRAWSRESRPGGRPLGWREKVSMLVEVARGLAAVHAAGVIHRDVKPDNIIVGRDGRARLGDFGLARSEPASTEPADHALALGSTCAAGTPAYMAPELLRGDPADPTSDQFSFGVTAYEVLVGERPFPGRTWAEIATAIDEHSPSPVPGPRWLDHTLRRCLSPDPAKRFPSMQAVALELASRLHRRRPLAWVVVAAVVASAATWFVVRRAPDSIDRPTGETELAGTWNPAVRGRIVTRWSSAADAPAALAALDGWATRWIAERDATIAMPAREACLDRGRVEFGALVRRLAGDAPDPAAVDHVVDAIGSLTPPDECRVASLGADRVPADRVDRARALDSDLAAVRAAIALGDARPVVDRSGALVDAATAIGHAPTLAGALLVRADALRAVDRFTDAATSARDAVAAAERGHDDAAAATAWLSRVALAGELRALDQADDFAAVAAAAIDRAGAPPSLVARLTRLRGTVAYDRGDLATAAKLVSDARARFATLAGERSVDVAAADSLLGSIARGRGELDVAEARHRAALAVDRDRRGPAHPDVARDLHNLAGVLRLRGDLDAAAVSYREALAIEIATRGDHSAEAGLTHNSLGLVAMARRDWPVAKSELEAATTALAGHGDQALAEHNLGIVAAAQGDHRGALAHYARAATIYHATIGDDAASPKRLVSDRARSELALGHRDVAIAPTTRPTEPDLEIRPHTAPHDDPSLGNRAPTATPLPPPETAASKRDVGVYGASQP